MTTYVKECITAKIEKKFKPLSENYDVTAECITTKTKLQTLKISTEM